MPGNVMRPLAVAGALVAAGVAANQILNDNKLSWTWAYLAFGFTLLGALLEVAQATNAADGEGGRGSRGSRRAYMRQVRASVADMETIGVVTQGEFVLRTRQVYVDVALQPRPVQEAAGDSGVGLPQRPPQMQRRGSLASFLVRGRALAVLGGAGSGKTTLARYTALDLAERPRRQVWRREVWRREAWRRRPLPVLLYLRDHTAEVLADEPAGLAQVAVSVPWLRGKIPADWLERRLERGRCVVLLDGLDEVAEAADRRRMVDWVAAQLNRYPGNAFVVTSRPHGYATNPLPNADVLQVQRFTPGQISRFLHSWCRAVERRAREGGDAYVQAIADRAAEDLIDRLRRLPALYDLAANPLLLTMIALVHRYRGALPGSRAALYGEMCDVLLHRRREAKNLPDLPGLDGPKKERITAELALHMMRRRQRDIPAAEAQAVIRRVLRRMSRELTPQDFLDYIRHSGLLVEREHGVYAFAHLTLQEYLAATLIRQRPADLESLTGNVDDPWWRETALLWSAGADAGPLVAACLDSGTVPALSLAFACAEHALDIDQDLRDRLDQALTAPPGAEPARVRLVAAVTASRTLHDTIRLDNGTTVCASLVTADLWNLFADHERHYGLHTPIRPSGSQPAIGIGAADARRFLNWLYSLFDDGAVYRLPTLQEINGQVGLGLPDLGELSAHPLWTLDRTSEADSGSPYRLRLPGNSPHPYTATITGFSQLINEHLYAFLRLALTPSRLSLVHFLAYAERATDSDGSPETDLIRALELAATIRLTRALDLSSRREGMLGPLRNRTLNRALGRTFSRAVDLARALGHGLDPVLAPDHDLTPDLDRALDLARGLARALALDLDPVLNLDRDFTPDPDLSLDLALAHVLDRDLSLNRSLPLNRDLAFGRDLDFALEHDLGLDPDFTFDHDLVLGLDRALVHAGDIDPRLGRDLRLVRDLAFARAFGSSASPLELSTMALVCKSLLQTWGMSTPERQPRRRSRGRVSWTDFLSMAIANRMGPPADDQRLPCSWRCRFCAPSTTRLRWAWSRRLRRCSNRSGTDAPSRASVISCWRARRSWPVSSSCATPV